MAWTIKPWLEALDDTSDPLKAMPIRFLPAGDAHLYRLTIFKMKVGIGGLEISVVPRNR
jgi:hypothetical protein